MTVRQDITISRVASELISETGMVNTEILVQTHLLAHRSGVPFGRALVMGGHLAEGDLTSLLQASQMVKQGEITKEIALPLLKRALDECLPFYSLIQVIKDVAHRKLADLLLTAQVISDTKLSEFIGQSEESGLTLGRILVLSETITTKQLKAAIDALVLVRGKCITYEQAALAIRVIWSCQTTITEALAQVNLSLTTAMPKVGELLCEAEILTELEVLTAAEIGIEKNKPIGEILFEQGLVPPLVLKAALRLQGMVLNGKLNFVQAHELLRQAHSHQVPVEKVLEELGELKRNIVEFLKKSRTVTDRDLRRAVETYPIYMDDLRALLASEAINLHALKTAVRCLNLITDGSVSMDQALLIFHYSIRTGTSVTEALKELTWSGSTDDIIAKIERKLAGAA